MKLQTTVSLTNREMKVRTPKAEVVAEAAEETAILKNSKPQGIFRIGEVKRKTPNQ